MFKEGLCELDVVTYGIVIDGLCKAGNVAVAIELLRVMEKRRSCKPDTHIYSMVIDGLCKDRMIDSALKLFDEMSEKDIVPNVVTYSALICGLCNLSRWGEVKMLLEKMIDYKS
ncbi:pentatricopeptide repeat-containing protein at1g62670 mitochondrial [Phtheirospermum japonicum]|uniref:Pentatricopeptide repeat-containing protein at1g62670 mitochondrial n=1 Tax=Phtheirospermum japonicum TaxID=374723 RepID=A0A830D784_9LAMI|nr:pentatricopeptide repeat-containing protein at1g62670 mitochondrial [Phtheirospermum japonicum]